MQRLSQKKWAARCRTAHAETKTVSISHAGGDVAHYERNLVTNGRKRGDRRDGDQGSDQRVLDGGGAMLVLHQATENGQHWNLQKKRTFFDRHSCRLLNGSGDRGNDRHKRLGPILPLPQQLDEVWNLTY